jgi:hypothetical protein
MAFEHSFGVKTWLPLLLKAPTIASEDSYVTSEAREVVRVIRRQL